MPEQACQKVFPQGVKLSEKRCFAPPRKTPVQTITPSP
jgi:hypothetical protein